MWGRNFQAEKTACLGDGRRNRDGQRKRQAVALRLPENSVELLFSCHGPSTDRGLATAGAWALLRYSRIGKWNLIPKLLALWPQQRLTFFLARTQSVLWLSRVYTYHKVLIRPKSSDRCLKMLSGAESHGLSWSLNWTKFEETWSKACS